MRGRPILRQMMMGQRTHHHLHGLFPLWMRRPLKVQLVSFSANLANNITVFFGSYTQDLQFSYLSGIMIEQKQGSRACVPLNMLLLLR